VGYWLEKPAYLLLYTPQTAYDYAERTKGGKPTTEEELIIEAFRRLLIKPSDELAGAVVDKLLANKTATPELVDSGGGKYKIEGVGTLDIRNGSTDYGWRVSTLGNSWSMRLLRRGTSA